MEADIIAEGFNKSVEMHGIKYKRLIGNNDSSVITLRGVHQERRNGAVSCNYTTKEFHRSVHKQWGEFHKNLFLDEASIRYFDHHCAKQFIRAKPVRFGYKERMLCSHSGYCYNFIKYSGAEQRKDKHDNLPLGSKVVLQLLDIIENPSDHEVYFDNYFTSYNLIVILKEKNTKATGRLRENRTKKCPLLSTNEMKQKNRGYYEYKYDKKELILCVRWKDNSIVTMPSNCEPLSSVKHWSKDAKPKIDGRNCSAIIMLVWVELIYLTKL
ncbi:hypothetical protein CBL_10065 [Carabus blaptoides fortunei]